MWDSRQRIGKAELGPWPQVSLGRKSLIVRGAHLTPQRERMVHLLAIIGLFAVIAWWIAFIFEAYALRRNIFDAVIALLPLPLRQWPYTMPNPDVRDALRYALAAATVALTSWSPIWLAHIIVRVAPWPFGKLTIVTVTPAAITWWRWGIRRRCDRALPHDFVVENHERARNARKPFYARATQVVIRCGVGKAQRLVVADIARDPNGDRANLFRAALEYADQVAEVMETEKSTPALRGRQTIGEG